MLYLDKQVLSINRGKCLMIMYMSLIDNEDDKIKFEDIYNKYKKMMFWIASQILTDERYIDEVVQESFIKIIKNLDKIEKIISKKT